MDQILDTPAENERKFEYAGFWIRVAAYIIDAIILWIVNYVILLFAGGYDPYNPNLWMTLVSLVMGILYLTVMESSDMQGTLGKMAVGIKVGDQYGKRISFGNALGRYFAKILSALILCIGFMMVGWDERKQGLHDKIAGTFVFYK